MNSESSKRLAEYRALCCKKPKIDPSNRNVPYSNSSPTPTSASVPPNKPSTTTPTSATAPPKKPIPGDPLCDFNDPASYCWGQAPPLGFPTTPNPNSTIPKIPEKTITTNSATPNVPLKEQFPFPEPTPGPAFLGQTPQNVDPNVPQPPLPIDSPDDPDTGTPNPPVVPTTGCPNMHPNATIPDRPSQAQIVQDITNYVNYKGFKHDPDGISWLPRTAWTAWDGTTTINPCTSTKEQLKTFIFPPHSKGGSNTMRGLRELFYQVNPFKDNSNPTVAEIENWNIEVIRHFRRLLGFNQTTHPVSNHKGTFLEAAWAEERARSNHWSATYPPEPGKPALNGSYGPCAIPNGPNAHCGSSFLPSATDQIPYLCGIPTVSRNGGAEGVLNVNTDLPWAIKMSRIIGTFLDSDGIGAHTGPFVGREFFGSAWWMNGGQTIFRGKWNGRLAPTCP